MLGIDSVAASKSSGLGKYFNAEFTAASYSFILLPIFPKKFLNCADLFFQKFEMVDNPMVDALGKSDFSVSETKPSSSFPISLSPNKSSLEDAEE